MSLTSVFGIKLDLSLLCRQYIFTCYLTTFPNSLYGHVLLLKLEVQIGVQSYQEYVVAFGETKAAGKIGAILTYGVILIFLAILIICFKSWKSREIKSERKQIIASDLAQPSQLYGF